MAEPCKQESIIGELKSDNKAFTRALEGIENNQKEFIRLLQEIASQGEQIKTLFTNDTRHDKDIDAFGGRIRTLELEPGKQASQLQMYGISAIIAAVIGYIFKRFI